VVADGSGAGGDCSGLDPDVAGLLVLLAGLPVLLASDNPALVAPDERPPKLLCAASSMSAFPCVSASGCKLLMSLPQTGQSLKRAMQKWQKMCPHLRSDDQQNSLHE
jgi:hypothetical protein